MIRGISEDILKRVYDYSDMTNEELRCKFFQKLQECIELCNNTSDIIDWIKNVGLPKEVKDLLTIWLEDGTLEELINIDILNKKVDKEVFDATTENINNNIATINEQLDSIAIEVSKYGASPLLEDNAIYIQKALNETGIVMITKPGIYNTSGLVIKSNTILILGKDVILRLKNGANQYLIVNEHWKKEETIWDENIHIIGGTFDFNKENNTNYNGNIQVGEYIGCGIVLNHIKNFSVTNINKLTNAKKYCILYGNAINGKFENIRIENDSDGIHAQCNLKNIDINNISGVTGDNMIPFTLGDYTHYTLSDEGDIENITISNIYGDIDTPQMDMIRFIGSGKNNVNKIKNVKIKNVKGNTGDLPLIWFMNTDTPDGNIYLKNTVVENIEIDNIEKTNGNNYLISFTSRIKNLKIKNLTFEGDISTQLFYFNNTIENFEIENFNIKGKITKDNIKIFKTDGLANLYLFLMNNINIMLENETLYNTSLFELRMYGVNQSIKFNNYNIIFPNGILIENSQSNGNNAINNISLENGLFNGGHIYKITGEYIHKFNIFNSTIKTSLSGSIGINGSLTHFNTTLEPTITNWKELTFANGWQKHPASGLSISKNGINVLINGLCQTTGQQITTTDILTLPDSYKPTIDIYAPIVLQNRTNSSFENNILKISTSGVVSLMLPITNSVGIMPINIQFEYKTQ